MRHPAPLVRRVSRGGQSGLPWQATLALCIAVSVTIQVCAPPLWAALRERACSAGLSVPGCPTTTTSASDQPQPEGTSRRQLPQERRKSISYMEEPIEMDQWMLSDPDKWGVVRRKEEETAKQDPAAEREALAALLQARHSRRSGHHKKAGVIIEHALALLPTHPDILVEYGIHLEKTDRLVEADGFCSQALALDPRHSEALECRARTQPIVADIDREMLHEIRSKRERFSRLPRCSTLRRAMRESYFSHIYHTVAIEGNTLSLGETRAILESGMAIAGKSIREHNEVLGMDSALRFLNRSLIHLDDITLEDVLEMHRRVLGHAFPSDAGRLRDTQVYVGRFTPVAPQYVKEQMRELIDWLNEPTTADMDPVERAAIAHYKLVVVHPFVDGNGRTARLLLNLILMKAGFPPVVLPVSARAEYYATLHTANLGDLRPFVRFVARHVDHTLQSYINLVSTCSGGDCSTETELYSDDLEVRGLS